MSLSRLMSCAFMIGGAVLDQKDKISIDRNIEPSQFMLVYVHT